MTIILGIPAYLILRRIVRATLWASSLAGGAIAALPFFLFALIQRLARALIDARLLPHRYIEDAQFFGGLFLLGAIGGAAFYFVVAWNTQNRPFRAEISN